MGCIFCSNEVQDNAFLENELAYVVWDKFPKTNGHCLAIPKRHSESFFQTTRREREAVFELLGRAKTLIEQRDGPDGFNILINTGAVAGQVVFHAHVHLIPRYKDDGLSALG